MLTKKKALELVAHRLQQKSSPDDPFVVVERSTIEKPFGWVFFYNSKRFLDTEDFRHRLAGNGPVIVNKHTGSIEFFGSSKPVNEIIAEYEKTQRANQ